MKRDYCINIGLLLGSILIFFFGIEMILRVTGLQSVKPSPPPIYQKSDNPRISYELIPNSSEKAFRSKIFTNSLGFRSPELVHGKPLIAVIGDSIAFGYGVENDETLTAQLEELIPKFQFLNAAVPGYNPEQEIATYNTKIDPLDPEAIILVFYWNDLDGSTPAVLDDSGILRSPDWDGTERTCNPLEEGLMKFIPGKCWLDDHTAFYKAFKKLVNYFHGKRVLENTREEAKEGIVQDPVTTEQLAVYEHEMDRFLTVIPSHILRYFVIWPDRYVHNTSKLEIIDIAEEREFIVIDLYETFGNEAKTLGWDTVHPHKDTLRKAAEIIAGAMKK